jgi:hypothetical protein
MFPEDKEISLFHIIILPLFNPLLSTQKQGDEKCQVKSVLSNIIAKIKGRKLYVESQSSKLISHISYSIGVII